MSIPKDYCPLYVKPAAAVLSSGAIRVWMSEHRYFDITDQTELIWAILEACNGYRRVPEVVTNVRSDLPGADAAAIRAIIDDLTGIGVLVDHNQAYTALHALTNNVQLDPAGPESPGPDHIRRQFTPKPLDMAVLLAILKPSFPLIKLFAVVTKPSAGYPPGYYGYDAEGGKLVSREPNVDPLQLQYIFNRDLGEAVAIVIATDLEAAAGRHGNRGYRYAQLEAGQALQSLIAAATAAGIAATPCLDFIDAAIATELGLGGDRELPLAVISLGSKVEPDPASATFKSLSSVLVGKNQLFSEVRIAPDATLGFYMARAYKSDSHQPLGFGMSETSDLAAVKALAEAYEVDRSGNVRVEKTASANQLAQSGASWIDPRAIATLTSEQYGHNPQLQPFDEQAEWQWVSGQYAATGRPTWVPVDLVFYPLDARPWRRQRCAKANSSGVAAHPDRLKAVENGLTELIERHAILKSWYHRQPPPQVPLKFLPYHWQRRAKHWQGQGRKVYVLDLSAFGVTVISVNIVGESYPSFVSGAGSSIDSFEAALTKAFHEAEGRLQSVLQFPEPKPIEPSEVTTAEHHAALYAFPKFQSELQWLWSGPLSSKRPRPTSRLPELLAKLEAVTVELSDQDAPLHVVRVLSRHLVPITFGYGMEYYAHPSLSSKPVDHRLPHYFP